MPRFGTGIKVHKNNFFTYFQINGHDGTPGKAHRVFKQVWNIDGVQLSLQGPMGGETNVFAKKHILCTDSGGLDDQIAKAGRVLQKRMHPEISKPKRTGEFNTMVNAFVPRSAYSMDGEGGKRYAAKKHKIKEQLEKGYDKSGYGGTKPPGLCTFLIVDGMTRDDVGRHFIAALKTAHPLPWPDNKGREIEVSVRVDGPRVITYHENGNYDQYWGFSADAKFVGGVYHVYHLNTAIDPENNILNVGDVFV